MLNQVWGKVGKVLGSLFLVGGGTVSGGILLGMAIAHPSGILLALLWTLMVFFGLVPAALGGWLLHTGGKADQLARRERFFQLVRQHQGRLSVMHCSAAMRLEPAIARQCLDSWAKEFAANFDVDDAGEIYYVFTIAALPPAESQPFETWTQTVREFVRSL